MNKPDIAEKPSASSRSRTTIAISLIDRPSDARPLDLENVERLAKSIKQYGLMQTIHIVAVGERFEYVSGGHRLAAHELLGIDEIDAEVMPVGTPRKELLARSLHDNIHKSESLQDTLQRVMALAEYHDCSFKEAAKIGCVTPSTLSKINAAVSKLCPDAMRLVEQKKIGISVAYETAKGAKDTKQQVEWLEEHAAGRLSRAAIVEAAKNNRNTPPGSKGVSLDLSIDGIRIKLGVPQGIEYEQLLRAISTLRGRFAAEQKMKHPIDLLPRLMSEGGE